MSAFHGHVKHITLPQASARGLGNMAPARDPVPKLKVTAMDRGTQLLLLQGWGVSGRKNTEIGSEESKFRPQYCPLLP